MTYFEIVPYLKHDDCLDRGIVDLVRFCYPVQNLDFLLFLLFRFFLFFWANEMKKVVDMQKWQFVYRIFARDFRERKSMIMLFAPVQLHDSQFNVKLLIQSNHG